MAPFDLSLGGDATVSGGLGAGEEVGVRSRGRGGGRGKDGVQCLLRRARGGPHEGFVNRQAPCNSQIQKTFCCSPG